MKRGADIDVDVDLHERTRMDVVSNLKLDTSIIIVERRHVVKTGGNYISLLVNEKRRNSNTYDPEGVNVHEILSYLNDHGYEIIFCTQSSHQNKYDSYDSTIWTLNKLKNKKRK